MEIGPATEHHSGGIGCICGNCIKKKLFSGTEIWPATKHHSGGRGCISTNCIKKKCLQVRKLGQRLNIILVA